MQARVIFDVQELYYLAQYLPVYRELKQRGIHSKFAIYKNRDFNDLLRDTVAAEDLPVYWVRNQRDALAFYLKEKADWVVFGNHFFDIDALHTVSKSAQFGHGVGPKMSYYTKSRTLMTVRFVEGQRRYDILKQMYPDGNFVLTGFAKLDPLFNREIPPFDIVRAGLDPSKTTLLYAPTFYPSSLECFPDQWPKQFDAYNLVVKPHFFSLAKAKYANQRKKLRKWASAPNVYVAQMSEHSLLPFMAASDVLISEASSALFEFAAFDKPIVWCDFYKLRWTYRGPLRYRFTRRMDQDIKNYAHLGAHVSRYRELKAVVDRSVSDPDAYAENRSEITQALVGATDGKASCRIADYLTGEMADNPNFQQKGWE
ncbi:MAG: CDP-glycerol--poly(glycerophosphate) glycerophosphotransferase [Deltaproteobacteria bacterium]|nr:MAG: CDP-glycerol--poly(glycerophosphate) glycerophosphotransferase [Deltaproteobacteria bacterium]